MYEEQKTAILTLRLMVSAVEPITRKFNSFKPQKEVPGNNTQLLNVHD